MNFISDESNLGSYHNDYDIVSYENETNLKIEIKNIESSLQLFGFPSFSDVLNLSFSNINILKSCLLNLNKILQIKQKDNEIKIEYLQKISRIENEKHNIENNLNKSKNLVIELTEKLKKLDQIFMDKKKKWKDQKQKLINEYEEEAKLNNKLKQRENQYNHEIKKRDSLVNLQNEKIKKILLYDKGISSSQSKDFNYSSTMKSSINLSYTFATHPNNHNTLHSNNINSKILFTEEIQKNLEINYQNIKQENDAIKNLLLEFHSKLANLVDFKKDVYLSNYKKTFGIDFPNETNLDLNASKLIGNIKQLYISFNIDDFIEIFHSNFIKLQEYLIKGDEINLMNSSVENKSKNSFFHSLLNEKTIVNLSETLDSYKNINRNLMDLVDKLFLNRQNNDKIYHNTVNELINANICVNNINVLENIYTNTLDHNTKSQISNLLQYFKQSVKNINELNLHFEAITEYDKNSSDSIIKFQNDHLNEIENNEKILENILEYCKI